MAVLYQHRDQCHGGGGGGGCCHCRHHHHRHPSSSATAPHPPMLFSCFPGHALPHFFPPVTPYSCYCMSIFCIQQFGCIPSTLLFPIYSWAFQWPSSLRLHCQNLFWDSVVDHPYYETHQESKDTSRVGR